MLPALELEGVILLRALVALGFLRLSEPGARFLEHILVAARVQGGALVAGQGAKCLRSCISHAERLLIRGLAAALLRRLLGDVGPRFPCLRESYGNLLLAPSLAGLARLQGTRRIVKHFRHRAGHNLVTLTLFPGHGSSHCSMVYLWYTSFARLGNSCLKARLSGLPCFIPECSLLRREHHAQISRRDPC